MEFGLINKWKLKYNRNVIKKNYQNNENSDDDTVLKLKHVFCGLAAIMLGWVAGTMALFAEIFLHNITKDKKRSNIMFQLAEMLINDDRYVANFKPEFL